MSHKTRIALMGLLSIALIVLSLLFIPGLFPLLTLMLVYLHIINAIVLSVALGRAVMAEITGEEEEGFFYRWKSFLVAGILFVALIGALFAVSVFLPPVTLVFGLMAVATTVLAIATAITYIFNDKILYSFKALWEDIFRKKTPCFIEELDGLHRQTRLSFYQRLYPTALSQQLEEFSRNKTKEQAFEVYKTFNNTWFFQRWILSSLCGFYTDATEVYRFVHKLPPERELSNFNAVIGHPELPHIAKILSILNTNGLLKGATGQENFNAIVSQQHLVDLYLVLSALGTRASHLLRGTLGQKIFNAVASYAEPARIILAIDSISQVRQADFERLMRNADILLIPGVWNRIPRRRLTLAQLERIIAIAETHAENPTAGRAAFLHHVNTVILGIGVEGVAGAAYNPVQSTHTASVHQSASESARLLKSNYGSKINSESQLTAVLDSLSTWLEKQANPNWFTRWFRRPDLQKIEAARRGLDRIRHPFYVYTDPHSSVSIQELIALLWVAITDDAKRSGTLQDAQQWMVRALCEIQRGYNLSDKGVDRGGSDQSICASGAFNKFIEKFTGIHRDVNLIIITCEGASAKFQALVKEEALAYLNQLKKDGKTEKLSDLLNEIMAPDNQNSAAPLWSNILECVATRLFEEYKSLYGNDKNNTHFQTLLSTGEYVQLPVEPLEALRKGTPPPATTPATATPMPASQGGFFAPGNGTITHGDTGAGIWPISALGTVR